MTLSRLVAGALLALLACACSPTFDWRETHGSDAPYVILLPGKPAIQTRTIDLGGIKADMTMTAVQLNGAVFAVGSAQLPSDAQARAALPAMRASLLKNIRGQLVHENQLGAGQLGALELDATGTWNRHGQDVPVRMVARLLTRERRVYQLLAVGEAKALPAEAIDTFMTSFKLN